MEESAMKFAPAIAFLVASFLSTLANAEADVVGAWKLKSFQTVFQDGSAPRSPFGQNPLGYTIFTAQGRVMVVVEAEGRNATASTDEERAALYRTSFSYTGVYRIEGDRWTTNVDAASNPGWTGTEQVRVLKLSGDTLETGTNWTPASTTGVPASRGVFIWDRVK
jgi:Lipocalin-like domain